MKISHITKHRNSEYGVPKWGVHIEDGDNSFHQWLLDTFSEKEKKHIDQKQYWERTWWGKQYHNHNMRHYYICGEEIMTMFMLRWS